MQSLGRLLFLVVIAVGVALPLRALVVEPITIASGSMEPTLKTGELLLLDKFTLSGRLPRRGEIVSFRGPDGHDMVKRVIGLPGDEVQIKEKVVFVNGAALEEPYAVHRRADQILAGDNIGPLTVPPESYFLLGDNRDESNDSSVWKDEEGKPMHFLPKSALQGLVRRLPWA